MSEFVQTYLHLFFKLFLSGEFMEISCFSMSSKAPFFSETFLQKRQKMWTPLACCRYLNTTVAPFGILAGKGL